MVVPKTAHSIQVEATQMQSRALITLTIFSLSVPLSSFQFLNLNHTEI